MDLETPFPDRLRRALRTRRLALSAACLVGDSLVPLAGAVFFGWSVFGAVAASHLASLLVNFLGNGEYRRATAGELMTRPYRRIFVLHLTIIAGGFLFVLLGSPAPAAALLVVLETVVDLRAHLAEHAPE